jgi:hypothetical protein
MNHPTEYRVLKNSVDVDATFETDNMDLTGMTGFAIQAKWSNQAALAGNIKLQASNDKSTWDDVASSSQTFAGNASFLWNVTTAYYRYVRIVVTITGGEADFFITGNSKGC